MAANTHSNCPCEDEEQQVHQLEEVKDQSCLCCSCSCHTPAKGKEKYYTEQLRTQDIFWVTTIKQYENQIKYLQNKKYDAQNSINRIENTMLPFITFLMIQLSMTKPDLDVNMLLCCEIFNSSVKNASLASTPQLPDLSMLQHFIIQDNDILYMDIIKALAEEAKHLKANIDHLQGQEDVLMDTKTKVDQMFRRSKGVPDRLVINGQLIKRLHSRLVETNSTLVQGIDTEKVRTDEVQKQIEDALKLIKDEEERGKELEYAFNVAGANVDIATIVSSGKEKEDEIDQLMKEVAELNIKYKRLQCEWQALSEQNINLQNAYRKKKLAEFEHKVVIDVDDQYSDGKLNDVCDCYRRKKTN